MDNYHMVEGYHSTKMEYPELPFNVATSIWRDGRVSTYTGALYPVIALNNFRVQARLIDLCVEQEIALSTDLISGVHHALSCGLYTPEQYVDREERPGEFKNADSVSGFYDAGTSPGETEDILNDLVEEMPNIRDKNDILVAGAYLHARLLFLRPFAIFNTATSIAIMNYWLRLEGHPPVVIPSGEISQYRGYLEEFDVKEDIEPLVYYLSEKVAEFWGPQMKGSNDTGRPRFTLKV